MRKLAFVLLLFSAFARADAGLSAEQWLQRMNTVADTLNYQGTLVYSHGRELVSFRLTHVRDGNHEWEHLVQLDGRANEVLRGGGDLIYKSPGGASTRMQISPVAALRPDITASALARGRVHYRFTLTPGERIAGREAVQVIVAPLQADRYSHVFFIDRQSGLLLRSRLQDGDGQVLETLGFSSLSTGPEVGQQDYRNARRAAGQAEGSATPAAALSVPARWQLQAPEGFVPDADGWHARQINGSRVELASYGDGFSSFSIFSEALSGPSPRSGQNRYGATSAVSRVVEADGSRWLLTVMGELPMATVQRIADSVQQKAP